MDRLSERLELAVRDLRGRVRDIETIVFVDSEAIEAEVAPGFEDHDVDMDVVGQEEVRKAKGPG